jgi:8-oxo-dGTP diphosphatase
MPSITTDVIVLRQSINNNEILLIKRKNEPYKDCWALPGGFMEINETLKECAIRELHEETGLCIDVEKLENVTILDDVNRDSRGRVISVVYFSTVEENAKAIASDDAKELEWFDVTKLPKNIAFDHLKAIDTAITNYFI